MSISILQHTQGIQGYQLHHSEYIDGIYTAYISKKSNKQQCVTCKSFNITASFINERVIKVLPMGIKPAQLRIRMHRLACHDCQAYRMENIQFISASTSRVSKYLERLVVELRQHMSIKAVAAHYDLHWGTVKNIEKKYLKKKHKKVLLKDVESIGIDEVFMGKKFGKKDDDKNEIKGYLTIVRDLKSGAVVFVGKGKKGTCLDEFSTKVRRSKAVIKYVAVDLAPSFTSWIKRNFPDATIVYDHFHVIKLMNDRLSNVRRRIMGELEMGEKSELKGKRWHFNINCENLTQRAKEELKNCCDLYEELGKAYALKEALRRIYSIRDVIFAQNALVYWCERAENSGIREMISMAKTIRKHGSGIIAFWETGITSASMEGFNNKIGWLTRQAYGYRDVEYLILKIFDLPNLKIAKEL